MRNFWRGRIARFGILAAIAAAVMVFAVSHARRWAASFNREPTATVSFQSQSASKREPPVELSPLGSPPTAQVVDMFAAIDRGDLAARLLPEKNQQARVELENRTGRPLTVEVPKGFGARFILAGVGMPFGQVSQPVGAARGGGPGFFCIPPEKVGYFRARTACLDESKPEPSLGMVYEVCRLEVLTDRPAVRSLCEMLGDLHVDPQALQAAVWHLGCNQSWTRLAARLRSCSGPQGTRRLFTARQIEEGKRLTEVALR